MPDLLEVAEIVVGSERYRDWQTVAVSRTFGSFASEFSFTVASPVESGESWAGLKLKIGDPATIRLGGRKAIQGVISARQVAFNERQHGLMIKGLSKVADLVQSSVEAKPGEYKNYGLPEIARNVLKPHGISFVLKGDTEGADKKFERVNVAVGETVFALIERLCRMRNLFLIDDVDGNLVAYRAEKKQGYMAAQLEEGRNVKSATCIMCDEFALSKIEAVGQQPSNDQRFGDDARASKASVTNSAVKGNKPLVLVAEMPGDDQDMKMRAEHEKAQNLATMLTASVIVQGWFCNGRLWSEMVGETVSVRSPMMFPEGSMSLAIQGVTHTQGPGGTETAIELVLPGRLGGGSFIETTAGGPQPGVIQSVV